MLYHRGKGPLGETLAIFCLAFWDVMGNPMNGTENNDIVLFSRDRFIFFGVILEV